MSTGESLGSVLWPGSQHPFCSGGIVSHNMWTSAEWFRDGARPGTARYLQHILQVRQYEVRILGEGSVAGFQRSVPEPQLGDTTTQLLPSYV